MLALVTNEETPKELTDSTSPAQELVLLPTELQKPTLSQFISHKSMTGRQRN